LSTFSTKRSESMITLELRLNYPDKKIAEAVCKAIAPDNGDYVQVELHENTLILFMKAESAGTMKNTADDLLACIKTAEESSGLVVPRSAADLDSDTFFE
jgi:hypothetical protein